MKSTNFISRLSIVSIDEGEQLVQAKHILVGRNSKKVEFLNVGGLSEPVVPLILAFKDIIGIGNDYIVIQSNKSIKKLYESQEFIAGSADCLILYGTTVLSSAGDVLGRVKDYAIDEKSGAIVALTLDNDTEVQGASILSLAEKFILALPDGAPAPASGVPAEEVNETLDFLLGKVVKSDVVSEDGAVTIQSGTVLTQELISVAERHDIMLALTMSV